MPPGEEDRARVEVAQGVTVAELKILKEAAADRLYSEMEGEGLVVRVKVKDTVGVGKALVAVGAAPVGVAAERGVRDAEGQEEGVGCCTVKEAEGEGEEVGAGDCVDAGVRVLFSMREALAAAQMVCVAALPVPLALAVGAAFVALPLGVTLGVGELVLVAMGEGEVEGEAVGLSEAEAVVLLVLVRLPPPLPPWADAEGLAVKLLVGAPDPLPVLERESVPVLAALALPAAAVREGMGTVREGV